MVPRLGGKQLYVIPNMSLLSINSSFAFKQEPDNDATKVSLGAGTADLEVTKCWSVLQGKVQQNVQWGDR